MSGIAGVIRFDGAPPERDRLARMLQALRQRGPHGQEMFIAGQVALGCTRLNLAAHNNRPAAAPDPLGSDRPLVFDGRLDNRRDLTTQLDLGRDPVSEAGLILAAYQKWGTDCPRHLLGDFAFALWDQRTRSLFCARDPFGVKPFYYHYSNRLFIFASSPYAILAAHRELSELNDARIADFLVGFEGIDETVTFYQRIVRLPRGRSVVVDMRGTSESAYWELQPARREYCDETEVVEAFHTIFAEAVKCRLGTPDETVVPLSGGLDSTAIVSAARDIFSLGNTDLITLSAVAADPDDSETGRIQAVLAQGGLRGGFLSNDHIEQQLDRLVADLAQADEPFDTLENSWRALYGQARETGIHVSLDGIDGDLTLSGAGHISALWKAGDYRSFLGETLFADGMTRTYYKNPLRWLLISLRSVLAPNWLKGLRREFSHRTAIARLQKCSLISRELAQKVQLGERQRQFTAHDLSTKATNPVERHTKTIQHPHLQAALERYDRIAAAYSIESRHPFLDVRLVEFCLGLHWHLKTWRGWNKMILRKAMEPALPAQVVWGMEKKHPAWGFSMQILQARKEYFREVLSAEKQSLENYIDTVRLAAAWDKYFQQGGDDRAVKIWDAIGLAFWLRRQKKTSD